MANLGTGTDNPLVSHENERCKVQATSAKSKAKVEKTKIKPIIMPTAFLISFGIFRVGRRHTFVFFQTIPKASYLGIIFLAKIGRSIVIVSSSSYYSLAESTDCSSQ